MNIGRRSFSWPAAVAVGIRRFFKQCDMSADSELSRSRSRGPEGLGRHQVPVALRQQMPEPRTPRPLSSVVGDQVLANFNGGVRQAALLAVYRDSVIGCVGDAVGLIVADHELRLAFQQRHDEMGKARVAIVE